MDDGTVVAVAEAVAPLMSADTVLPAADLDCVTVRNETAVGELAAVIAAVDA